MHAWLCHNPIGVEALAWTELHDLPWVDAAAFITILATSYHALIDRLQLKEW
jgi:hypothetical protein